MLPGVPPPHSCGDLSSDDSRTSCRGSERGTDTALTSLNNNPERLVSLIFQFIKIDNVLEKLRFLAHLEKFPTFLSTLTVFIYMHSNQRLTGDGLIEGRYTIQKITACTVRTVHGMPVDYRESCRRSPLLRSGLPGAEEPAGANGQYSDRAVQ